MLDPKPNERVLDPACGTGGFLTATLAPPCAPIPGREGIDPALKSTQELNSIRERLAEFVRTNLFGADFDPFLVRATMMSLSMAANGLATSSTWTPWLSLEGILRALSQRERRFR